MTSSATTAAERTRVRWQALTLPAMVVLGSFAVYLATSAPSILSGDQAEHQYTAWVVGVPHATGYPLFTMLNAVAVRIIPVGDVARRVTLAVVVYSTAALALVYLAGRRLSGLALGGALAAISLAVAPEWWSLATIAEVYTLQALFVVAALLALIGWWALEHEPGLGLERHGLRHPLALAAFLSGLGVTHHGSFAPTVGPALVATVIVPLASRLRDPAGRGATLRLIGRCLVWAALGLAPWLYLAAQYLLFRPFDYYRGQGLPYHPYWGNPASWGEVANLALGAGFRLKVFTHGWSRLPLLIPGYGRALVQQFWWSGLLLGALGALVLLRRGSRSAWFLLLVWLCSSLFGLNVAADIPKAHVYFLPAFVIWSLWIAVGASALAPRLAVRTQLDDRLRCQIVGGVLVALLLLPVGLGMRRYGRMDRSGDWTYRADAEQILAAVEPNAVILCRWEVCMPLRYLQLVEGLQPGVQLDQTEPEAGALWSTRVPLYTPGHPVYTIAYNEELAARYVVIPVETAPDLWRVGALRAP